MEVTEKSRLDHDTLLIQGINLCIVLAFSRAQKILKQVLQLDANDALAWLWLSRTFTNIKNIKIALEQANKLNSLHPEIKKDITKVTSAPNSPNDQITRCPFCYAPIPKETMQCYYCHSYVVINPSTLPKMLGAGNRHELYRSLGRFYSLKEHQQHSIILFYSGLGYLNMGDPDKSLEYFNPMLLKLEVNDYYRDAAQLAVNYIESNQLNDDQSSENQLEKNGSNGPNVLVVEDSRMIRKAIVKTLGAEGFNVREAEDGVEALEELYEKQPDLVLLDIVLPKLDGYYVLSVMKEKEKYKHIPVIILTSRDSFKDKLKGRFSAANAYLTKPFEPEELIQHVNKHVLK